MWQDDLLNNTTHNATTPGPSCEVDKSIFPCSTNVYANVLLMLMYGFILGKGSSILADGSELLLDVLDPGLIGGFLLPLLGALPDATIVILSVLSENPEELDEEVKVGIGTLAGSTIMLLTIAWSGGIILGRCDLDQNGEAIDKTLTRKWNVIKTGVTCEKDILWNSRIMAFTSSSYLVILIVSLIYFGQKEENVKHQFVLAGFIICILFFVAYSIYSVCNVKRQEKIIGAAQEKVKMHNVEQILVAEVEKLEEKFEASNEKRKTFDQLNIQDSSEEDAISIKESVALMKGDESSNDSGSSEKVVTVDDVKKYVKLIEEDINTVEGGQEVISKRQIILKSSVMLLVGAAMLATFSDPMIKAMTNFSLSISVSPFYTSFIVAPFASNASELIASLIFAHKKRKKNISLTFGAIYGAVIMNNTFIFGVFLGFFYFKKLEFTFYAEVISTLTVIFLMGALSSFKTTFQTFWAFLVFALYPLSILMVYFLAKHFGE